MKRIQFRDTILVLVGIMFGEKALAIATAIFSALGPF